MKKELKGVWPAMFTPVDEEGNPNIHQLEKLTDLLVSQELDGLYLLGSTGQGFLLHEQNRKKVTEVVASVVDGRLPVIVQVGSLTTQESVRLAKHAQTHQVDGISSVAPVYYSASDGSASMALEHYRAIASATDLPFFPYQLGESRFLESISVFVEKLMQLPNMAGMKLTTNNLLEISTIAYNSKGALTLFSGSDELMCQAALCGTVGSIGTTYNLWGRECQKVREEFLKGNVQLATHFMLTFQEVIATIIPNVWTFMRQAMNSRYGIDIGPTVAPLGNVHKPWEEEKVEKLIRRVKEASGS